MRDQAESLNTRSADSAAQAGHAGEDAARPLAGRTIAFLEARRASELTQMIERAGGIPFVAPALREVPVEDDSEIRAWLKRLVDRELDVVIFLTGSGCQNLLDRAASQGQLAPVLEALKGTRIVARGPKPARVLRQHDVPIAYLPPEPNTSEELLAELAGWHLAGRTIGLQLYGGTTPYLDRLRNGLTTLGAALCPVSPYRWEGPSDDQPVREVIDACLAGSVDAFAFLSSSQVHNLFDIAEAYGRAAELRVALNAPRVLVAAVGPVTAEAIESHGVAVDLQPEHPKMGHLVRALGSAMRQSL